MNDVVVDASVVVKWLRPDGEAQVEEAEAVLAAFEAGRLRFLAPSLLPLEVVNAAGRKWRWPAERLDALVEALGGLRFELIEPPLPAVARWTAAGLTAYDAAYVAVAEGAGALLVTADEQIVALAADLARPLAEAAATL
ncbi:PIN domain-containing protein [Conexibacter arvalis]|uniref:Ribonuclease VapC n=1 Tax=Conexibacter arvalis TaxID=912552 RepID=A0A840IAG7_9ACTN|nr:putative nucleic acid-binding protein [Conexibacter arvalis]